MGNVLIWIIVLLIGVASVAAAGLEQPENLAAVLNVLGRITAIGGLTMLLLAAIEGTVYDLTDYVPRHPAAHSVFEPWCGREATEGMRTKGDSSDHSARAWRMLERYRIGKLN